MIDKTCFKAGFIQRMSKEYRFDPGLIERAIYAFQLLGGLVDRGIDLVFKGGTSLMLVLPELRRFSIDVDIITKDKDKVLRHAFNDLVADGVFSRWEEDVRPERGKVPKLHYRFYYFSNIANKELYILLDILNIDVPYQNVIIKPIALPFFACAREVQVKVPTINGLAGDKLTAFAPTTIGILYGQGKSMEIIKQLFDIGALFNGITDLNEVGETYRHIALQEASFRNLKQPMEDFLDDTVRAAFLICQLDFRGYTENEQTRELRDGIGRVRSHIRDGRYTITHAKEDASRAACLASLIRKNRPGLDMEALRQGIDNVDALQHESLPAEYKILEKFKKIAPGNFYLWWVAVGGGH